LAVFGVSLAGIYATASSTLLPAYIDDWVGHLGVSDAVAGYLGATGLICQIPGMLLGLWLIAYRALPGIAALGFLCAGIGDGISLATLSTPVMVAARILNGIGSGLLLAATINWLGRDEQPDRGFGVLTLLQFVGPAIILSCLSRLAPVLGHAAPYTLALAAGAIALLFIRLFRLNGGDRPLAKSKDAGDRVHHPALLTMAVVALAAFNIAQMGIWAFLVRYAESSGIAGAVATRAVAISSACGIPGSLLVVGLGLRFGRVQTILVGCLACLVPMIAFTLVSATATVFLIEACMLSLAWAFLSPYIQGTQALLDPTGRLAVWGMIAAAAGASIGPAVVGTVSQRFSFHIGFAFSAITMMLCAVLSMRSAWVATRARLPIYDASS